MLEAFLSLARSADSALPDGADVEGEQAPNVVPFDARFKNPAYVQALEMELMKSAIRRSNA